MASLVAGRAFLPTWNSTIGRKRSRLTTGSGRISVNVRSMDETGSRAEGANDSDAETSKSSSNSESTPPSPTPAPPTASPKPITGEPIKAKAESEVSTRFEDIFAFTGPAPETINGRLAMLGFVGALAVEVSTGSTFVEQLRNGGLGPGLAAAAVFTVASLVPMFRGVTAQSRSKPFWSSDAEIWNGRVAMIGLVALAITEYVNGQPLV